jgi:hypothetical protein
VFLKSIVLTKLEPCPRFWTGGLRVFLKSIVLTKLEPCPRFWTGKSKNLDNGKGSQKKFCDYLRR